MTDVELTKLAAEAMGYKVVYPDDATLPVCVESDRGAGKYDPLHDDAQAMALVKKFDLSLWGHSYAAGNWKYHAEWGHPDDAHALGHGLTHNQAIVECVAKMQERK